MFVTFLPFDVWLRFSMWHDVQGVLKKWAFLNGYRSLVSVGMETIIIAFQRPVHLLWSYNCFYALQATEKHIKNWPFSYVFFIFLWKLSIFNQN